jgi:cation diffusion facilitator CzcD-associated flavoprotein CzcO
MTASVRELVDHVVIGTGFSGLAMANELVRRGYTSIRILERDDGIGGVWRTNTYPGAACDVPSHLYSLAALPDYDWSRVYPPQAEILDYLESIYRDIELARFCTFNKDVISAEWNAVSKHWQIACADGEEIACRFIYAGTGQLPVPTLPQLPGSETFKGALFHSSRWRNDVDLTGQRIAVVGTGASAIQIIPELAKIAGHLTVIQRNAPYILPRRDRAYRAWERKFFLRLPGYRSVYRAFLYIKHEINGLAFFTQSRFFGVVNATTKRLIRRALPNPMLRAAATPKYKAGCKRILVSDDYLPSLARSNVTLVASAADRFENGKLVCIDDTAVDLDAIIFATGFIGTRPMPGIRVVGREGKVLHQIWEQEGVKAFYGTQKFGFPNLFTLIGPNVGLAHNSVIYMMESQVEMIGRIISQAITTNSVAEVKSDCEDAYNLKLDKQMAKRVWQTGGCSSWYHDDKGRNVGLWPEYTFLFRHRLRRMGWETQIAQSPNCARL